MHATADSKQKKEGMRTGYTTGACAAAAAKAATRILVTGEKVTAIETTLPNGQAVTFTLHQCLIEDNRVMCSVIKDAGDDPDCTHGAEIQADVCWHEGDSIQLEGGQGVAQVTKPGLGLDVGGPAINPVPRQNIRDMVQAELDPQSSRSVRVRISVPDGEERAKKTLNARLGLLGGISILGTTGLVLPYSTSAFIASVRQAIELAAVAGCRELVFTTGGRSETYAMKLMPHLSEQAFIQVGDYIGIALRHSVRHKIERVAIVGMMGKLTKMADGRMMTHASASQVNVEMLSDFLAELNAPGAAVAEAREANTARHVLELCQSYGIDGLPERICQQVVSVCQKFARAPLALEATMVDFNGNLLGSYQQDAKGNNP
jgi:cobalt-precorrin-5B (C1)-methyltransferase